MGRRLVALAAVVTLGALANQSQAATFIYGDLGTANDTDTWSSGEDWTGATAPPRGSATTLQFGGTLAAPAPWNTTGVVVVSDNDLGARFLNASGRFDLNQLVMSYRGLTTNTAPNNVAPQITVQGGALEFVADGIVAPAISLRANSNSTGTAPQKAIVTLANNLHINSPTFTISALTNFNGGSASGNIRVTGSINFVDIGPHALTLDGDFQSSGPVTAAGRAVLSQGIGDQSPGNATSLTKSGTSMWELGSANTYSGGTTITNGTLMVSNLGGLGSGSVSASGGGSAFLNAAGTWAKNFSISGNGAGNFGAIRLVNNGILGSLNTVTLTGDARIGANSLRTETAFIESQITGTGTLTFGTTTANSPTLVISNPANNYVGNTIFQGEQSTLISSSSTSAQDFILGASDVIPAGDVTLSMGTRSTLTLQMRGKNETINGLNFSGAALLGRTITNGLAASTSVLTLGDNNGNGSFRGSITGSSTSTVAVTKIGSGNQILNGSTTYFGNTIVNGGKLTLDYNLYSSSQTNAPVNYFSQNSTLVLNGGSLAFGGRGAGSGVVVSGSLSGRVFSVPDTSGFVAGQSIQEVTATGGAIYIAGIDRNANTLYLSEVPVFATPNTININAMAAGTTSQAFKGLTLAGAAESASTIDFGTSGNVVLTINSAPLQINDGSLLSIANWSGIVGLGGGSEQLLFLGEPIDFASVFNQSEVSFAGYGTGYAIIDNIGNYEVIAVPEPTSFAVLAFGGFGLLTLSRRRR